MKVYFIRHGQSECNSQRRHSGWCNTPLSELGHQQAKKAGLYLKDIPFDIVYSSDLPRAMQTAQDALPGCRPIPSEKIREISVGSLAGRLMADCRAAYGDLYVNSNRKQDFSAFGGESQAQICERIRSFIHDLEQLEGVEHVAVFGHEGTVHQMINYVLGHEINIHRIQITNASATVFSYTNGKWKLVRFNYTGEL